MNKLNKMTKAGKHIKKVIANFDELSLQDGFTFTEGLRESNSHLRQALRIATIASLELDYKSDDLFWSDEVYRIFKIRKVTAFDYEKFLQAVLPEDRECVDQQWQAVLDGEPGEPH